MTIIHSDEETVKQASVIALSALGWILADDQRAQRFLDLTGLTPASLRSAIDELGTLRAVIDFLCAHEPDLIGAARELDVSPEALVQAKEFLK